MTGFAGRFARDGAPVALSDLEPMALAAGLRVSEGRVYVGASFGIAAAAPSGFASTAQATVVFDGRLDNRRELAAACGLRIPGPDDEMPDAAMVLAAYERFDDQFASHLNGDFALALFDVRSERVMLARDVMSARPLYHSSIPGSLLFGTRITSLLADPRVPAAPDEDGLAELVLDYWSDEERTCFKGISAVPAGHLIVVTRERIERKRHWAFDTTRQITYGSFGEYCDAFRPLFATAVERRLRNSGPVAIGVSGGVDSSSIFCQAAALVRGRQQRPGICGVSLVFPAGSAAAEGEFVDAVEHASGVPVVRVPASSYRFLDQADEFVRHLEAPGVMPHTQHMLLDAARRAGCNVLLGGFFGDQMMADRGYLVDLARRGRWRKVRHDLRELRSWTPDADPGCFERDLGARLVRGLSPRLYRLGRRVVGPWRERSRYPRWFTDSFRRSAAARARTRYLERGRFSSAHAEQYFRHVTAGHYTHSVRCQRAAGEMHGVDVSFPFRDRDLVSFLMAIPGEIVNWQGRPKGLLREALQGIVPDAILGRRSKADFTALENRALANEHADFTRLLEADALAARAGFVDSRVLRESLPAMAPGGDEDSAGPGWSLTDVVGLELWLKHFFGSAVMS